MTEEPLSSVLSDRQLFDRGIEYIEDIKNLQKKIMVSQQQIDKMDKTMQEIKDSITLKVLVMTDDDTGKKKYTNETARKNAVNRFIVQHPECQAALLDKSKHTRANKNKHIELEYKRNLLRLIISFLGK
jgi:hypothetical protein